MMWLAWAAAPLAPPRKSVVEEKSRRLACRVGGHQMASPPSLLLAPMLLLLRWLPLLLNGEKQPALLSVSLFVEPLPYLLVFSAFALCFFARAIVWGATAAETER